MTRAHLLGDPATTRPSAPAAESVSLALVARRGTWARWAPARAIGAR
jgi:hypothetical protein